MKPRNCPDCGASPGSNHEPGCDVERCPDCGGQRLSCDHHRDPNPRPLPWAGEWPGDAECRAFGWYCHRDTCKPVPAEHPAATEDLNRLVTEARWNREARRWEKR